MVDNVHYYDRPEDDQVYFKAFHNAGMRLQECMNRYAEEGEKFKWIRMRPMWPSYDDLTFSYKQSIFSVKILLCKWESQNGKTHLLADHSACAEQISACEDNGLIPCVFPVNPDGAPIVARGWNLWSSVNFEVVLPKKIASDVPTECLEWEKNNFAIDAACNILKKQGYVVDSFCDIVGIEPQICFHEDGDSKHGWCKVINAVGALSKDEVEQLMADTRKGRCVQVMSNHLEYDKGCIILINFLPVDGGKMLRQKGCFIKDTIMWIKE